MRLVELRKKTYRQLEPTAWPDKGLSPVNLALVVLIVLAVLEAVLDTEPTLSAGNERLLADLELGFGIVFSVEYLARVWIAVENPRFARLRHPRLAYMASPIAIIDLLAVLPALFAFGGAPSLVLRFFRVLRMLRLAKLGRTSKAWRLVREAIVDKRQELSLMLGLLAITVLLSGSLLYWAEGDAQPDKFGSIPRAMWWAIVTLTTVGYGDVYPITGLGRVLAGMIAILGIMLIALPAGLFAASFTDVMERERAREAAEAERLAEKKARLTKARKGKP